MKKEIYLAGGCFWGLEKYFNLIEGVLQTEVGYANGKTKQPTYKQVCLGNTDFVETVHVVYEDNTISLLQLLQYFYKAIDPTSKNKQGNDKGTQYRTGIYYTQQGDRTTIQQSIEKLQQEYDEPIMIEIKPLSNYYKAEDYHQKYLEKNPNGYCHISQGVYEHARKGK